MVYKAQNSNLRMAVSHKKKNMEKSMKLYLDIVLQVNGVLSDTYKNFRGSNL